MTLKGQKTGVGAHDTEFATGPIVLPPGLGPKDEQGVERHRPGQSFGKSKSGGGEGNWFRQSRLTRPFQAVPH